MRRSSPPPSVFAGWRPGGIQLLMLGLLAVALIAAISFRWQVFVAGSKYYIILALVAMALIWMGRLSQRQPPQQ
ncbi:MAG: hypothetical protein EA401_04035 [Planctomycetota bacterium]|nr:MAG: hypothetical protein EA401_04035 [Planctomycetota bacterium]